MKYIDEFIRSIILLQIFGIIVKTIEIKKKMYIIDILGFIRKDILFYGKRKVLYNDGDR